METKEAKTFGAHMARSIEKRLVGRDDALDQLKAALEAANEAPRIVSLIGPPGVGKTALSTVLRLHADSTGVRTHWVWCEHIANIPSLQSSLGAIDTVGQQPSLLVIDAFEALGELGEYFLRDMLPNAGPRLLVLLSSRTRLSPTMRATLRDLHEEIELGVLSDEDSRALLRELGVEEQRHESIVRSTGGLPLALVLAAEQAQASESQPVGEDVVSALAQQFVQEAPDVDHQRALFALSMIPLTPARLSAAIDVADALPHYEWLQGRSFVRDTPNGLSAHDWVRNAIYDDLAFRRPEILQTLAERIAACTMEEMRDAPDIDTARRIYIESFLLRRDLPRIGEFFALDEVSRTSIRRFRTRDQAAVATAIHKHEGAEARAAFDYTAEHTPEELFVTCGASDRAIGLVADIQLHGGRAGKPSDPLMRAAADLVTEHPEWEEDGVKMMRWLMSLEDYMAPGVGLSSVMLSGPVVTSLGEPVPRRTIFAMPDPEQWAPMAPMFLLQQLPLQVEFANRLYGYFMLDFAAYSDRWQDAALIRGIGQSVVLEHFMGLRPPRARIEREAFDAAVRDALACFHRAHDFERNPLVHSLLVGETDAPAELRTLIRTTVKKLENVAGYADAMLAVDRTYIHPAVKQRAAAAELGIPFGTYRHRLRRGMDLAVEAIWRVQEESRRS